MKTSLLPALLVGLVVGCASSNPTTVDPPTGAAALLQCQGTRYFQGTRDPLTQAGIERLTFGSAEAAATAFLTGYQTVGRDDGKPVADGQLVTTRMRPAGSGFGLFTDGRLDFAVEVASVTNGFAVFTWASCEGATPNAEIVEIKPNP